MCKLWMAVTPPTDSSSSLTAPKLTSRGAPSENTHVKLSLKSERHHRRREVCLPSSSILKTSFVTGSVVPITRRENRKVQIGSATLYSGCEEDRNMIRNNWWSYIEYLESTVLYQAHPDYFCYLTVIFNLTLTQKWMMVAASMTPTLCTRSPTTWTKAAFTLALPWPFLCPCLSLWVRLVANPWLWPCELPGWCKIRIILGKTKHRRHHSSLLTAPLNQAEIIHKVSSAHSQDIDPHSTAWCYEHDLTVNLVFPVGDPLHGW